MKAREIINYNDRIKSTDFYIKLNRNTVFHIMDCLPDSPIYQDVVKEYEALEEEFYSVIEHVMILQFGKWIPHFDKQDLVEGTPVCYVIFTIGKEISELSSLYFSQGNYLAGMLVNAMANDYTFQLDEEIQKIIRIECALRHVGVLKRLEAPADIPLEVQKVILEETGAAEELNIELTTGFMFTTVKTSGYILVLTEDETIIKTQHNCEACDSSNCKMRTLPSVNIILIRGEHRYQLIGGQKESILEVMLRNNLHLNASCGGKGNCGKCKIRLFEGNLEATAQDKVKFTEEELAMGYRLSCYAFPKEDCIICLEAGDEADFEILVDQPSERSLFTEVEDTAYGVAIDIGTTTIAISLVGLMSKRTLHTYTTINKQRGLGADVISRMLASNEGKNKLLQEMVRNDLLEGIRESINETKINQSLVKKITIAGNTTMGHLLMGYSCESLGAYPFIPVNIGTIQQSFSEIFESDYLDASVTLLPGISTFVGADIVAGLINCSFDESEESCLLIDLGTNGEMAIGNKNKILVTSTAAGLAFEGGNISCGIGSISGAISDFTIDGNQSSYHTIHGKPPIGICGTGVIEITSEILKTGIIDETGLLEEKYFTEGYEITTEGHNDNNEGNKIVFTQRDIREIQLAKAAVRAGIEILIRRYGITYHQINTVYLAGGFGYKINIEKAIHIGLLPKELAGKIKAIGNSSLAGAKLYLLEKDAKDRIKNIISVAEEINLANDKDFNDLYVDNMFF